MIGNDLIDLHIPLSKNWDTNRYLNKLYSTREQKSIFESNNPIFFLQLFWSLKESAYKAHQRKFELARSYNPIDFSCEIISYTSTEIKGKVLIGNFIYHTLSTFNFQYIHSIARFNDNLKYYEEIFETEIDLKKKFLIEYSNRTDQDIQNLILQKNEEQIPFIFRNNTKLHIDFSLSHHGKFSAYVLALTNS